MSGGGRTITITRGRPLRGEEDRCTSSLSHLDGGGRLLIDVIDDDDAILVILVLLFISPVTC